MSNAKPAAGMYVHMELGKRYLVQRAGEVTFTYEEVTVKEISPSGQRVNLEPLGWVDRFLYEVVEVLP